MPLIQDETLQKINYQITRINNSLQRMINQYESTDWATVRSDVRNRRADQYCIGDELTTKYTYQNQTYDFPWIVMDNQRPCLWEDGSEHPGLWLCAKYLPFETLSFDAPENERATETNALEGVFYYAAGGQAESGFIKLDLNAGDPVPYGDYGIIIHNALDFSRDGQIDMGIYHNGYNRYAHSAVRQWLNSDYMSGGWWTPQHVGDCPMSTSYTIHGFMHSLDQSFTEMVRPVQIRTFADETGDVDITYDRFFPLSIEEIYARMTEEGTFPPGLSEGPVFPYWKKTIGTPEPKSFDSARIRTVPNGTPSPYHLRSGYRTTSMRTNWDISTGGGISVNTAGYIKKVLPACCIS